MANTDAEAYHRECFCKHAPRASEPANKFKTAINAFADAYYGHDKRSMYPAVLDFADKVEWTARTPNYFREIFSDAAKALEYIDQRDPFYALIRDIRDAAETFKSIDRSGFEALFVVARTGDQ